MDDDMRTENSPWSPASDPPLVEGIDETVELWVKLARDLAESGRLVREFLQTERLDRATQIV